MKIAVDFQSTQGERTGIGVSALHLVEHIARQAPDIEFVRYTFRNTQNIGVLTRMRWESLHVPLKALRDRPDLVYSPGFAPAFFSLVPQVVTVHDLIGMVYPQNLTPAARFYWSRWLPLCVRRAKVVVASSESTRRDIGRYLGRDISKIPVVPLAASGTFRRMDASALSRERLARYGADKPFLLAVGTLEARKNIPNLLTAFAIFKNKTHHPCRLVIAGKCGGESGAVARRAQSEGMGADVTLAGYVSDDDLNLLYNACLGYVLPSLYEGFGLPALEAMSCGASGLVSNVSSLPEVAGDTALYFEPRDVRDIAGALERFCLDDTLRKNLSERALDRARTFSWSRSAQMMIEVFRKSL